MPGFHHWKIHKNYDVDIEDNKGRIDFSIELEKKYIEEIHQIILAEFLCTKDKWTQYIEERI